MVDIAGPRISTVENGRRFGLVGAERLLFTLLSALAVAAFILPVALERVVVWRDFLPGVFLCLALMGVGLYARYRIGALRLSVAAVGVGLFMGFSTLLTVLIFALFPLHNPVIDPWLIAADAVFGFHWATFVIALAEYPALMRALAVLYNAAVPLLLAIVVLLGALGRIEALHRMLMVGLVTLIVTVAIWWCFPSIGPSAYQTVPQEIAVSINLVFAADAGALLRQLVEDGPEVISKDVVVGVVAFPSYHTVMACMVVWYTRRTFTFPLGLALGVAMVPAILSHGGHNMTDVLGGLALFMLTAFGAARLLPDPAR